MISTERFFMRPLTTLDVSDRYLSWLLPKNAGRYLEYSKQELSQQDLREYISQRENNDQVLFLGIFEKTTQAHIGNIKFEPIDQELKTAIMGIMIGENQWHGKGVAVEVLLACGEWLKLNREVNTIVLGCYKSNIAAIKAYEKVGFVIEETPFIPIVPPTALTMAWHL